jgi:hypothetical protein
MAIVIPERETYTPRNRRRRQANDASHALTDQHALVAISAARGMLWRVREHGERLREIDASTDMHRVSSQKTRLSLFIETQSLQSRCWVHASAAKCMLFVARPKPFQRRAAQLVSRARMLSSQTLAEMHSVASDGRSASHTAAYAMDTTVQQ